MNELKKQFKNIMKIILKPHFNYRLVEKYEHLFCNAEGAQYDECLEECINCKYSLNEVYDFALIQTFSQNENVARFILFNDSEDKELLKYAIDDIKNANGCFRNTIYSVICDEKSMYKCVEQINSWICNVSETIHINEIEPYKKIEMYTKYAQEFFEKVVRDFNLLVDKKILPIRFFNGDIHGDDNECDESAGEEDSLGAFYCNDKLNQHMIAIFHVNDGERDCENEDEDIKNTIRHEILHYILYVSYLKDDDDSAAFHVLAKIYDAGAYEELNNEEQELYNNFFYIYENAELLIEKYLQDCTFIRNKKRLIHYMLRYIGHKLFGTNEQFLKMVEPVYRQIITECNKIYYTKDTIFENLGIKHLVEKNVG